MEVGTESIRGRRKGCWDEDAAQVRSDPLALRQNRRGDL